MPESSEKKTVTTPSAKFITSPTDKGKESTPGVKAVKPSTGAVDKGKLNNKPLAKPVSANNDIKPPSTGKSPLKTPISKTIIQKLQELDKKDHEK